MTEAEKRVPRCPVCGKPSKPEYKPFCSARCADIDLHRWLTGSYVIPGPPIEDEDAGEEAPNPENPDED